MNPKTERVIIPQGDYEITDQGVQVLVSKLAQLLPKVPKYRAAQAQQEVVTYERDLLQAGVDATSLTEWVRLHCQQVQSGQRSQPAMAKLFAALKDCVRQYGVAAVNAALAKAAQQGVPGKCSLPYLRSILKNDANASRLAPPPAATATITPPRAPVNPAHLWDTLKKEMQSRLAPEIYSRALQPTRLIVYAPHELRVRVCNQAHQQALRHIEPQLRDVLAQLGWQGGKLIWIII